MSAKLTIAIAGNPNCGKWALFNAFTGVRQRTGNWPGVTVDRKKGHFDLDDRTVVVIDLPGIYSLDASSLDEQITRDYPPTLKGVLLRTWDRVKLFVRETGRVIVLMVVALNLLNGTRCRQCEDAQTENFVWGESLHAHPDGPGCDRR